jgi:hypothetical protein
MATLASTVSALAVLRQQLHETADALAKADLDQLLICEAQLQAALAALNASKPAMHERAGITAEVTQIRALVGRCRRLGGSLTGFVHTSLEGIGGEPAAFTFRHSA